MVLVGVFFSHGSLAMRSSLPQHLKYFRPSAHFHHAHSLDQYTEEQKEALEDCCPTQVQTFPTNLFCILVYR